MSNDVNGSGGATGTAARVFGHGLAGVFGAAGRLRPSTKPLHPRGSVATATLRRVGLAPPVGVDWLDRSGDDEVLVRFSRSVGLPGPLPDILGLAVRVPTATGHGDILFSTTGSGPLGRFVLMPARNSSSVTYSTLLPYRTPAGPVLLAVTGGAESEGSEFTLSAAVGRGPWRRFGSLHLRETAGSDEYVAFDPMTNTVPDLEPYEWVRQLRERSYRAARHTRGDERLRP